MTPNEAQTLQDQASARSGWIMWFVSTTSPEHPDKAVAWAMTADPHGGTLRPGELIADTLKELRAMLPAGLKRRDRTSVMPAEVAETWA